MQKIRPSLNLLQSTELELIAIKNEIKLILIMMNGEEGSLSTECNGDANTINIVETMKFKIAAISMHDDAENEEFYEFYEELEATLNVTEEAKEIKIDMLVKADIHVDAVSDINIDISVRNINVDFFFHKVGAAMRKCCSIPLNKA